MIIWKLTCFIFLIASNTLALPFLNKPIEEGTYVTSKVSSSDMIGEIKLYAGDASHLPVTWMLCHGQALSRTTYAALFSVIGESFGSGDGTDTFNLPDLRSRFVMGRDPLQVRSNNAVKVGHTGGQSTHILGVNHLPAHFHSSGSLKVGQSGLHTHEIRDPGHAHKFNYGHWDLAEGKKYVQVPIDFDASWGAMDKTIQRSHTNLAIKTDGNHLHSLTGNTGAIGNGESFSVLNPYQTLDYIIFTGIADQENLNEDARLFNESEVSAEVKLLNIGDESDPI